MEGSLGYILTDKKVGFTGDGKLCKSAEEIVSNSDASFYYTSNVVGN